MDENGISRFVPVGGIDFDKPVHVDGRVGLRSRLRQFFVQLRSRRKPGERMYLLIKKIRMSPADGFRFGDILSDDGKIDDIAMFVQDRLDDGMQPK